MTRPTVLVTACGCPGGPSVVRALRQGCRVIGTDMDPRASGRFEADAFYLTPHGAHPDFVPTLAHICRIEAVDAVLPESSAEVLAIAEGRHLLEETGAVVMVSEPEAVRLALDKAKTYKAMKGSGVPLPAHTMARSKAELWAAVRRLGFPERTVVLKQPNGKGGRGIRFLVAQVDRMALDWRQWPNALLVTWPEVDRGLGDLFDPLMVMEYLVGDESSADTFDGYGSVLGFTKIRRDCRHGVHFHHESRYDPELSRMGRRVVEALGLEYFVNVQFMAGKLLEVNPRISTQILSGGFNLPLLGVEMALGRVDRAEVTLPDGVRAQYYHDLQSYVETDVAGACGACRCQEHPAVGG